MRFDVAVVGGGPSGCSAALSLLKRGYSVAIISGCGSLEKATETAAPHLKGLLHQLGAEAALGTCDPCYGITSNWGRTYFATQAGIFNPLGNAYFVYRTEFDATMSKIAVSAGAKLVEERASNIQLYDGAFIATANNIVEARWLVIATGSVNSAARITNQKSDGLTKLMGVWAYLPQPVPERYLYSEATEVGWWYACPRRSGSVVCLMTRPEIVKGRDLAQNHEWCSMLEATRIAQMIGFQNSGVEVHASLVEIGKLPRRFGVSWIAVGDAALKFDPIGSCGIVAALDSGRRAAEAIVDHDNLPDAMSRYQEWGENLFAEFIRQRQKQYKVESYRRGDRFWHLAN